MRRHAAALWTAIALFGCDAFDYGPRAFLCVPIAPSCPEGYGCVDGECRRGRADDPGGALEPEPGAHGDGNAPPPAGASGGTGGNAGGASSTGGGGSTGSGGGGGSGDGGTSGGVAGGAGPGGGAPGGMTGGAGAGGSGGAGGAPPPRMCATDADCAVPFECCAPGLIPGTPGTCTGLLPLGLLLCPSQSGGGGAGGSGP